MADEQQAAGGGGGGGVEDWSGENLDEVLLTELQGEGGRPQYIVYRNGAVVDAGELESLCDKVGWPRRPLNKVRGWAAGCCDDVHVCQAGSLLAEHSRRS